MHLVKCSIQRDWKRSEMRQQKSTEFELRLRFFYLRSATCFNCTYILLPFKFFTLSAVLFQMDLTPMEVLLRHIDFGDSRFCIAVIAIIFNPLFWNVVRTTADHTVDIVFKNQALFRNSVQQCLYVARLIRTTVWLSKIFIWSGFGFFFFFFVSFWPQQTQAELLILLLLWSNQQIGGKPVDDLTPLLTIISWAWLVNWDGSSQGPALLSIFSILKTVEKRQNCLYQGRMSQQCPWGW